MAMHIPLSAFDKATLGQKTNTNDWIPSVPIVLALYDLFMFSDLQVSLKGSHIELLENIQRNVTTVLKRLSEKHLQQCLQALQRHWKACIKSEG
jgi:hypothetical protein